MEKLGNKGMEKLKNMKMEVMRDGGNEGWR